MYQQYFKRIIDVVLSLVLAVALSWVFILIILLYILCLEFPVFFMQERIGRQEGIFTLIKFRTLKNSTGSLLERRFFPGNLLRFTSLDELPQLWNVIKGEMSLVGPRPLPVHYLPLFTREQRSRHTVRPGITGWAQVNGRHSISWEEKFNLDLYYTRHVSLALDAKIIVRTILMLLSFKRDVSLTEKPFEG